MSAWAAAQLKRFANKATSATRRKIKVKIPNQFTIHTSVSIARRNTGTCSTIIIRAPNRIDACSF